MAEPDDDNPLKPTKEDRIYSLVKAAVAGVPVVGGSAAELLGALIQSPLDKRRDAWFGQMVRDLAELQERHDGFSLDSLAENEEFVSAVQHATQIAARTHQQEKLDALRNAVLNVAAGTAPADDLQLMFLSFVDTFTLLHLRMLKFFQRPNSYAEDSLRSMWNEPEPIRVMGKYLPIAGLPEGFCEQVFTDLVNRALLNLRYSTREPADWLHERHSFEGILAKRTTPLGDAFLAFIESPIPPGD